MSLDVVELAEQLIRFPSVTTTSNVAITEFVASLLLQHGFEVERVGYVDSNGVDKLNLVARRGEGIGGIAYSAHTDVVPVDDWMPTASAAFQPKRDGDRLYGRGSCDMKGSLAAALTAMSRVQPQLGCSPLYFLVSADEEIGMVGAKIIARQSTIFRQMVESGVVAIVGEPTGLQVIHAHKGTLVLTLRAIGQSSHSSGESGLNANDLLFPALAELERLRTQTLCDIALHNPMFDPPHLSWNWIIRNEPYASNIKTSLAELRIFVRPMPDVDHHGIVDAIAALAQRAGLVLEVSEGTQPMCGPRDSELVRRMLALTGNSEPQTACYATDGGVLQELASIVVCGPGNIAQAHTKDEWISIEQLHHAVDVYKGFFRTIL